MKTKLLAAIALSGIFVLSGCAAVSQIPENGVTLPEASEPLPEFPSVEYPQEPPQTEQPSEPQISNAKYLKVTGEGVNIRTGAGASYSSLGSAEKNTLYAYLGESDGWYKTLYKNKTVYISKKYGSIVTMPKSEEDIVEDVIAEGISLLGTKYVYGAVRYHDGTGRLNKGFSVTAFDCSSLTQYMYYKGADKILQVTTRTQVKQGKYVAKKNLKRGDLMFFTNEQRKNNTGVERVGHVAVYLGDNYILHTASDYAKIEQISAKRWGFFIEGRRYI